MTRYYERYNMLHNSLYNQLKTLIGLKYMIFLACSKWLVIS